MRSLVAWDRSLARATEVCTPGKSGREDGATPPGGLCGARRPSLEPRAGRRIPWRSTLEAGRERVSANQVDGLAPRHRH